MIKNIENTFLASLPKNVLQQLIPELDMVELSTGHNFLSLLNNDRYVYFPVTAIVSVLSESSDGFSIEIFEIGKEGIIGCNSLINNCAPPYSTYTRQSGYAYRLQLHLFLEKFSTEDCFRNQTLKYVQSMVACASQAAVCSQLHMSEQRLAKWLLLAADRNDANKIKITRDILGELLGVNREAISRATIKLQEEGMIYCSRGSITLMDQKKLEACSCECYFLLKKNSVYQK